MRIYSDSMKISRIIVVAIMLFLFANFAQLAHADDPASADATIQRLPIEPDCRTVMCPPIYDGAINDNMNKCCKPIVLQAPGEGDFSAMGAIKTYSCRCVPGCDLCCGSGSQGCTVCGCSSCKQYVCDKSSAKMLDPSQTLRMLKTYVSRRAEDLRNSQAKITDDNRQRLAAKYKGQLKTIDSFIEKYQKIGNQVSEKQFNADLKEFFKQGDEARKIEEALFPSEIRALEGGGWGGHECDYHCYLSCGRGAFGDWVCREVCRQCCRAGGC